MGMTWVLPKHNSQSSYNKKRRKLLKISVLQFETDCVGKQFSLNLKRKVKLLYQKLVLKISSVHLLTMMQKLHKSNDFGKIKG